VLKTGRGAALLAEHGIHGRFILSVSHLYPYKNLVELVEGFLIASRTDPVPGTQLVLVGTEYFRATRLGFRRRSCATARPRAR